MGEEFAMDEDYFILTIFIFRDAKNQETYLIIDSSTKEISIVNTFD